ncbi:MAG: FAD-dependent oxidoreductase [Actinomycetota bacterium]|nr:FAD-dependent oxidoreductase [Actinomycetota bacterium]
MPEKKIAIIGGGVAGLAAGMYLARRDFDVNIFERGDNCGGLASGKVINGNIYEYGPHFFHTSNPHILNEIKEIAGSELIDFKRTILIKFMDDYFVYPLSIFEVLKKLPKKMVLNAALSLVKNNIKRVFNKPREENSETLLLKYYGDILYELFFKNYIYHVWGIYPDKFSPEFAMERIPRISGSIFLNKIISPIRAKLTRQSTNHFVENVDGQLFTTRIGYRGIINRMVEDIEKNGGEIYLNSEVVGIKVNGSSVREITVNSGKKYDLKVDALINTIPVNKVITMINPPVNKTLKQSAESLKFRALVFVGVLVNKPKVLPVSFMYFREHAFNRIYDSSYFSHDTIKPDTTILVAEISSSREDRWWKDDKYCKEMVLKDLLREDIIKKKEILDMNVYRYEYGYPVYKLGYEKHLGNLLDYIKEMENFETAGRQGKFNYINGHVAMQMGFEAAENIIKNK